MTASASNSTSQSGSMNRVTCMMVFAGRIEPKYSPCTAATACQSSILVSSVRVRCVLVVRAEAFAISDLQLDEAAVAGELAPESRHHHEVPHPEIGRLVSGRQREHEARP